MEENNASSSLSQSQSENQSQEEEKTQDVCLKCSTIITHIPYKYNGQTFHARCLLCNLCGKKLVGKPFITDGTKLFCGDQCKTSFEEMPTRSRTMMDTSIDSTESEPINGTMDESLFEALESIKESTQAVKRLTRQPSPSQALDPDRITDYPRNSSPDSSLARTPLSGSRCSSLSTMSQSSLTSDSSFSFDANKRPKKKILKHPHRRHRQSRNRVRWNLPGGEMNDGDNMSLESFDSTSTQSSVYFRAKRGVADAKVNWREFERHPSPGSTGLTPAKPPLPRNGFNQHHATTTSCGSPLHISNFHNSSSSNPPRITVNGISKQEMTNVTRMRRSSSPLTTTSPPTSSNPSFLHTSTPMRRINSDSSAAVSIMRKSPISEQSQANNSTCSNNEDDDIDIPPILQFDHSKLSILEESTLEDKKKAHIFPFPQNESAPSSSTPVKTPPAVRTAFLDDDDASDYDHLSPLANPSSDEKKKQTDSNDGENMYTKEDIDEAFNALNSSGSSIGSIVMPSPKEEVPPPVPRKKNESHYRLRTASQDSAQSDASESLSPTSNSRSPTPKRTTPPPVGYVKQMLTNYSRNNNITSPQHTSSSQSKPKPKSPQKPPPVPPKTRRSQRMEHEREDTSDIRQKTTTSHANPVSQPAGKHYLTQPNAFSGEYSNSPEDEILPPPPEFALAGGDQDDINPVSLSQGSDLLSSVSNSTLVDESQQLEGSPDSGVTSKYMTSNLRTKAENPPPVPAHSKHTSRNMVHPMKIKDRIVVGAEDPKQVRDNPPLIQKQHQFPSRSVVQAYKNDKIFRDQQHKPQVTSNSRLPKSQSAQFHFSQTKARASSLSVTPTSPRHKISMEMAFNDGNLLNHSKFLPPNHKTNQARTTPDLNTAAPSRGGLNATADSTRQQLALRGRSQSATTNSNQNFSSASDEQKQVWKTFNSRSTGGGGGIPPSLRTVEASSDNDLKTLFKDLEIKENSKEQPPPPSCFGICGVCGNSIQSSKDNIKNSGLHYHKRCFHCTTCRSFLRGKKVYKVRNKLLCRDCYPEYDVKGGQTHRTTESQEPNYSRSTNFHMIPTSGGQITSV